MLTVARYAIGNARARLRQLARGPNPVLLLGRERRWRWPWAVVGLMTTGLLLLLLLVAASYFEDLALRQRWISSGFPRNLFPLDPAQPLTYVDVLLSSLPFLLAPLIALRIVHGVSWRRAFSYRIGFQWRQFWRTALALLTLAIPATALGYLLEPQHHQFPARGLSDVPWIGLALGVIFVQSLGEEVLFRGYLLRAWGAVLPLRLPVTAAVIALFVTGHLWNEDVRRDLVLNVIYFVVIEAISYAMLFRTQNLAASAGLHWINNVFALLAPTVPGQPTVLALVVYTDPVYAAGGSRLFDPLTHAAGMLGLTLLLVMLMWRRSPFYLAKAPLSVSGDSVTTAATVDAEAPARP